MAGGVSAKQARPIPSSPHRLPEPGEVLVVRRGVLLCRLTGLLTVATSAACAGVPNPPEYVFRYGGGVAEAQFLAVDGDGVRPVPGDVLTWPFLVLDDVAEQFYEPATEGRTYRQTGSGRQLAAIEIATVADLAALSDDEAAGLRGIHFSRWEPAMARELERVDARRCLFEFGSLTDPVDLRCLPSTTRYLHMHYAKPVDLEGFGRFRELRYLAVPDAALAAEGEEPPAPDIDAPGPPIAVDWVRHLPELRWLDLEAVGSDLRPLGGHPTLHTVHAAHCALRHLPAEPMPALREFLAPFSDCPSEDVERLRRLHPTARIRTTARELLLDRIGAAARLQLRTGASCHPQPSDRVVYVTDDRAEIEGLLELLRPAAGFQGRWTIPGCERGVLQFFAASGCLLAEVGLLGAGVLRSQQVWDGRPAFFGSEERSAALRAWLVARGLHVGR